MGAGFVIMFWLIALGIIGAVWCGLVVLSIVGWKQKKPWLKWLAGVPAALMLAFGLLIGGLLAYGTLTSMSPNSVFTNTFHEAPSAKVSDIESSLWWFADTGSVYLRFKANEEEFRRLVPRRMTEHTMEAIKEAAPSESGSELPAWWNYQYQPNWIYFFRDNRKPGSPSTHGFSHETEYFAYDPKTEHAYYRFLGID